MSYADHYPWLRHSLIGMQSAGRNIQRLPACGRRERILAHLEAAERELNQFDGELEAEALESEPSRRRA